MTAVAEKADASAWGTGSPTLPEKIREWADRSPNAVAMREKDFGIWQEIIWSELWENVLAAAHGLLALGVEPGDRVSIHSEDRPEWVILDVATVAVRGITVGLYPTNPASEVKYLLSDSGPKVHLAEDQEQADKVMEVISDLPNLERIIHAEPRGFRAWREDSRFIYWDDFLEMGRNHQAENPGAVERIMDEAQDDDVMTLVYTSGTTGPPKGAMLTNSNFTFCLQTLVSAVDRMPGNVVPSQDDQVLTYLPLCHVAERIFSTWTLASSGTVLNFAESIETVQQNLREIQPTLFFAVPRIWEKLHAGVLIKGKDATPFKRLWFSAGLKLARAIGRRKVANGGEHTALTRFLSMIGYPLVFRPLLERVGLRRVRWAASGAAPIAPEVLEFFIGMGLPVYELYGMTENSAVATYNPVGRMKLGTVGVAYPGTQVRLDPETGEVQTKHEGNFKGYWRLPEKTAATFTEDGFLKTGDVGVWVDETHLKIVDRIKDIIITSGGKNVSPSEIENAIKASPYVKEAIVLGDSRPYLTALIGIELDTVADWAQRRHVTYTTYRDLSEKPEVLALLQGVVDGVNQRLARVEQVKRFTTLPRELDHQDGDLTATQKVKRAALGRAFGDLIESMYLGRGGAP